MDISIGQGIDFHKLGIGRKLCIGGVVIPHEKGLVAHSDGDVLLHAICDALLGAAGLEDIGYFFPDTKAEFKDIDSRILLQRTYALISGKGFRVVNIDSTLCLEKPKISPYVPDMKINISKILDIPSTKVGIKATTTEKMGFIGREEGVAAIAVALLEKQDIQD